MAAGQGTGPGPAGTLFPPNVAVPDVATGDLPETPPSILLTAQKFKLAINFFYHSGNSTNAEFGRARSASVRCRVLSWTSIGNINVVRGDFRKITFTKVGSSGGVTTYSGGSGAVSTL